MGFIVHSAVSVVPPARLLDSHSGPLGRLPLGRLALGRLATGLLGLAAVFAVATTAAAQVNPLQALIGDAVSDAATPGKYPELETALMRMRYGAANEAYEYCKAAKEKAPLLPPAEIIMVKMSAAAQNAQALRGWLERAVKEAPDDPEAFVIFAESALREGRTTEADLLFARAQTLAEAFKGNPKRQRDLNTRALTGLTITAQRRENWKEALGHAAKWLKADDSATANQQVAVILFNQDRFADAEKYFVKANNLQDKEKTKGPVTPWEVTMGLLYQRKSDTSPKKSDPKFDQLAAQYMAQAVTRLPKDLTTRLAVAQWAMNNNKLDEALKNAEAAVAIDPDSLAAKITRGYVARLRNDLVGAEKYFEMAFLQAPGEFSTSNNLALTLIESDGGKTNPVTGELSPKYSRAAQFAQMNYQRFPYNGNHPSRFEAAATLGWVLFRLDRKNEAAQVLQVVVQSGALSSDSAYYVANILFQRNNPDDLTNAQKILTNSVESDAPFVHRQKAQELIAAIESKLNPAGKKKP